MIEWDRVAELREEVGEEEFPDVVELFLEEVEAVLGRLGDHPSAAAMENDLHFVKGSAMTLGFVELSRLCQAGERRAASDPGSVDVAGVLASYRASKTAFIAGMR